MVFITRYNLEIVISILKYKRGVEIVKNVYDTLLRLKLDKTFFNISEDIYICAAFELLQDDVNFYSAYGTVTIVGDLKCRVGLKVAFIVLDGQILDIVDNDYVPDTA